MESDGGSMGYVRRSASQWRELIGELRRSGQSQAAFCASRGVALSSLGNWLRKLKGEAVPVPGPQSREAAGFIDLTAPTAAQEIPPAWDVELSLGDGIRLRLRSTRAECR